ncbi:MAG: lipid-A-disaccharide synthase [Gemmatimonadota bacterium]|nr:lipid-A-disaccharide synthase [Gemmatimonadota bacterium]
MPPTVYVSAGEPSGDRYAAGVALALRRAMPGVRLEAMGGPALAGADVALRHRMERLQALGLVEAADTLPAHLRILADLRRWFRAEPPELVVLVDYPGFHARVARAARTAGIPVLQYVAPQLWAWGRWRARRWRQSVDRLAVILPFEEPFFRALGFPVQFVGHPLLDGAAPDRPAARATLGLGATTPVLGLFPGSRPREIARLWPGFRDAAAILRRDAPALHVVVAGVPGASYPGLERTGITVAAPELARAAADAALAKSGTTTLELALTDTPHVVAYRMPRLTYAVARRVVDVPWVGLVNLLAGHAVVPELLQDEVTPARLAEGVRPLFERGAGAAGQRAGFAAVRAQLGAPGAADRVAATARELVS